MVHLRGVSLQGFKTFDGLVTLSALNPGVNAVVGANGAGKSTLLEAVMFVLCEYGSESVTELVKLGVLSANYFQRALQQDCFVELEFDNADRAFPLDGPVVLVRKAIAVPGVGVAGAGSGFGGSAGAGGASASARAAAVQTA